jgi:hypothetical protein
MEIEHVRIDIDRENAVSGALATPGGKRGDCGIILAHGAVNDMNHPVISFVCNYLAAKGYATLRFNFLYRELGKDRPDSQENLMKCYRRVIEFVMNYGERKITHLFIGGKSLGGRIASYLAEEIPAITGLIFLGYPLHAPGKTDRLRDEHLYRAKQPMLFISGTKDPLARIDLLEKLVSKLSPKAQIHPILGGNHSLEVPKSLKQAQEEVYHEASRVIYQWLQDK